MKYRIELSEEQMSLIAQCLEDVSRFASGQWEMENTIEAMVKGLPFEEQIKRRDEAEELLRQAKKVLLPEIKDNSSKGYNGTDFIGNTYQIYRTILHQFAKDKNWNNVYSSSALPSGSLGTIKIEALGEVFSDREQLADKSLDYLDFNSNIKAGQEAIELLKELRGFAPYCTDHRQRVDDILSKVSVDMEVSQNEA